MKTIDLRIANAIRLVENIKSEERNEKIFRNGHFVLITDTQLNPIIRISCGSSTYFIADEDIYDRRSYMYPECILTMYSNGYDKNILARL